MRCHKRNEVVIREMRCHKRNEVVIREMRWSEEKLGGQKRNEVSQENEVVGHLEPCTSD